jgi:hypothetical protein
LTLVHSPRATAVGTHLSLASIVFADRRAGEDEANFPRRESVLDISPSA